MSVKLFMKFNNFFYIIEANENSGTNNTGLVPLSSAFIFGFNKNDLSKIRLPPELQDLQTTIKLVLS